MTKTCLKCKESKHIDFYSKNKTKKDGLNNYCKTCMSTNFKNYYKNNTEKHKTEANKRKTKAVEINRQFVFEYLSNNPCVDCGETCQLLLDFDHVRGKKKFNISKMIHRPSSLNKIKEEILKCEIRCVSCHRKRTAIQFNWWILKHLSGPIV